MFGSGFFHVFFLFTKVVLRRSHKTKKKHLSTRTWLRTSAGIGEEASVSGGPGGCLKNPTAPWRVDAIVFTQRHPSDGMNFLEKRCMKIHDILFDSSLFMRSHENSWYSLWFFIVHEEYLRIISVVEFPKSMAIGYCCYKILVHCSHRFFHHIW